MLKNYINIAWRHLVRQKGFAIINIAGLAVGLACCILIMLWVIGELNYDRFHENLSTLYRVYIEDNSKDELRQIAVTPGTLAKILKEEIPGVAYSTRYGRTSAALKHEDLIFNEKLTAVDPDFLEMFSFELISGDKATALSQPHSIVLTESLAEKYFGRSDPTGDILIIDGNKTFSVTGVIRDTPSNSTLQFDCLVPFDYLGELEAIDFWSAWRYSTMVQLSNQADYELVSDKIRGLYKKYQPESKCDLILQPFADIHLNSDLLYDFPNRGDKTYVFTFSGLALFVLIIATINFINLNTALIFKRIQEVGVRKAVGAVPRHIMVQFICEVMLIGIIAGIVAIGLIEIFQPAVSQIIGKQLSMDSGQTALVLLILMGISVFASVIAGLYPAVHLARYKPAVILKAGGRRGINPGIMRRVLVIFQFVLTTFLFTGAIVSYYQMHYLQSKKLGFDQDHIVYIPIHGNVLEGYNSFKTELLNHPEIINVTAAFQMPTNISSSPGEMDWEGREPDRKLLINAGLVDFDYFETFGMEFSSGRGFNRAYSSDSSAYVINETAARLMQMDDPVGKWFSFWDSPGTIIGVVKDYNSTPLQNDINPIVLKLDKYFLNYIFVKLSGGDHDERVALLRKTWAEHFKDQPFTYHFLDEYIQSQYFSERRLSLLLRYLTIVSISIAALGLTGLVILSAERRTTEIGIRRVLGASTRSIVNLLLTEYLVLVLTGGLIAWPLSYYAMSNWLQQFAYRIDIQWWIFVLAIGGGLSVTLLTVIQHTYRAATTNPVKTLRCE